MNSIEIINQGDNPLVSIIVITYNSSKFVLETLESAKAQTYQNIELIVSDDCSTDNTVEICRQWLEENKERFVRTKLITVEKNSGIPANCNRGVRASKGEWVKLIAGDDILMDICLKINMHYVNQNPNKTIFFSQSLIFDSLTGLQIGTKPLDNYKIPVGVKNQFLSLLEKDFVNSPTVFIKTNTIREVGGFDERYPFMEDYPMWYKLLKNGFELYYYSSQTIKYRVTGNSLSNTLNGINEKWFDSSFNFYFENVSTDLKSQKKHITRFKKSSIFRLRKIQLRTYSPFLKFIYRATISIIDKL